MKKGIVLFAFTVFCFSFPLDAVFAQRGSRSQGEVIEVRLGSPLPRNSDWGRTLDRLSAEWARVTNNQVRLIIRHDGIEGSEAKMFSSLASNNIQGALFVSSGLAEICPAVMTLSIPFNIRNEDELDLVLEEVLPVLDEQVSRTNFAVVAWAKGGWVNVFSKEPVIEPNDLRQQKIATNPDLKDMNLVFRTMGFNVVEADLIDLGVRLANNVINAAYLTPAIIAPMQLHRNLTNMLEIPIAPFLGAIVVNRVTWNRISQEHQRELVRVTQRISTEFNSSIKKATDDAVVMMKRGGLRVHSPNQTQENLWYTEMNRGMPALVGTTYDRDIYERINVILERSRSGR